MRIGIGIGIPQMCGSGSGGGSSPGSLLNTANLVHAYSPRLSALNGSGTAASDGQTIATLPDQAGSVNLTQSTDANRPVYRANAWRGMPAAQFASSGPNFLATAAFAASYFPFTVEMVVSIDVQSSEIIHSALTPTNGQIYYNSSNFFLEINSGGSYIASASQIYGDGVPVILTYVFDGAASHVYLNGADISGALSPGSGVMDGICLGTQANQGGLFGDIHVYEYRLYNTAMGSAQVANNVTAYNTIFKVFGQEIRGLTGSGQEYQIMMPPAPANPMPLVIFSHGHGEVPYALTDWSTTTNRMPGVVDMARKHGAAVAWCQAHDNNWGNAPGYQDYLDLYNIIAGITTIGNTVLLGKSMGGLESLKLVNAVALPRVTGWYGIVPVTNLDYMYNSSGFGLPHYTGHIDSAFGITGTTPNTYAELTAGCDPNLFASMPDIRYRMAWSPDDTVVDPTNNSQAFFTKLGGFTTTENSELACSGQHGDPSQTNFSDLSDFFGRCL